MDKVVVYPGRFQPMLKHHVEVYKQLQAQYPDADVYIGTSDKVAPDSPFNFAEKQKIMKAHGIDPSRVIKAKNPYHVDSYPFDRDNTEVIFAVGEKDADQRFPANHVKKDGTPGYYQRVGFDDEPLPMTQRGYIAVAPNITSGGDVASASAFRQAMKNAKSPEQAKQIYTKQFGSYDPEVFNLIYNKVAGKTMEQLDLNHMRKMAGLSEAPGRGDIASRAVGQEMTDQQRQLADMGRALMNSQFKYDDELGNKMADVGSELTKFDTPEGSKSMEDMLRKLKMSKEDLLKFMKKAKELVDQGAHEMGRDMAGGEDEPEDEFAAQDADDDAMGAVDDMEVDDAEVDDDVAAADDELGETSLDLGDIRSDYGIAEAPGISMSNQGAENVTGSEDPHSKNDKHEIPYPYPPENNDQVNQNVKKYNRPTWEIDEPVKKEVEEGVPLSSGVIPYPEQPDKEGPMGGAQSQGPQTYAGDQVSVSELNSIRVAAGLEPIMDDVEEYPSPPAVNPYQAEVPLDGENTGTGGAGKPNKHYEPPHDPMYEEGDCPTYEDNVLELMRLAGIDCESSIVSEEPRYEREVQPYKGDNAGFGMVDPENLEELDPIVNEGTSEDIAQKLKDMGASLEDEDGFIKHLFDLSQQMKMGRYIMDNPDFIPDIMQAFKGLDESSMMCTKCGQQPCVGGPACGTMGTDEPGPNNPFPADPKNGGYHRPEEMSEGSGCPCCDDGPCNCESGCEGCDCGGQIDEVSKALLQRYIDAAEKAKNDANQRGRDALNRVDPETGKDDPDYDGDAAAAKEYQRRDRGIDRAQSKMHGWSRTRVPATDPEEEQTDEAIGDGFLSGNPSLADLLMKLDEMLDEVSVYRDKHKVDEIAATPAQIKADQIGAKANLIRNRIASRTGSKGKVTVVADPETAGDLKAYGTNKCKNGKVKSGKRKGKCKKGGKNYKVATDQYANKPKESVQDTVTNETIAMLRKLAGL
jgi:hypothetical protein